MKTPDPIIKYAVFFRAKPDRLPAPDGGDPIPLLMHRPHAPRGWTLWEDRVFGSWDDAEAAVLTLVDRGYEVAKSVVEIPRPRGLGQITDDPPEEFISGTASHGAEKILEETGWSPVKNEYGEILGWSKPEGVERYTARVASSSQR